MLSTLDAMGSHGLTCYSEGKRRGQLQLRTAYESIDIPFRYEGLLGALSLTPSRVKCVFSSIMRIFDGAARFKPSFAGCVLRQPIYVDNTFSQTVEVRSVGCLIWH